ncbi:MAG TPA: hypothetical protein VFR34_13490, partial [Paracoccaceae bacterium]|nr:hypothetical protein [Paracoccaceae bacterium]
MTRIVIRRRRAGRSPAQRRSAGSVIASVVRALSEAGARVVLGRNGESEAMALIASALEDPTNPLHARRSVFLEGDRRLLERVSNAASPDILAEEVIEFRKCNEEMPFDLLKAPPLDLAPSFAGPALPARAAGTARTLTIAVTGSG